MLPKVLLAVSKSNPTIRIVISLPFLLYISVFDTAIKAKAMPTADFCLAVAVIPRHIAVFLSGMFKK
jgi:hypothetical protein